MHAWIVYAVNLFRTNVLFLAHALVTPFCEASYIVVKNQNVVGTGYKLVSSAEHNPSK
jgi:hypothetical protein